MAAIIDGKAIAAELRAQIARDVTAFTAETGVTPGLAVVLVGNNPASSIYVRSKGRATREAGMVSIERCLPDTASQAEILAVVAELNAASDVHGILVQLPLPADVDPNAVIDAIDPAKDVDGFHPMNVGRIAIGRTALTPCTPRGCVILAKAARPSLAGLDAVIVGRSNIVGKPLAHLLLAEDATVTIAHSRSRDLPALCRRADVLVAAVGRAEMIGGDWIKPGATVIDVGINRLADGRIVGDVAYEAALAVAGAVTPVPGGVGPMTIACLLENTLTAARGLYAAGMALGAGSNRGTTSSMTAEI